MAIEIERVKSDRISQFIDLKQQGIEYVRFELPDLHGVSRLKVVPVDKLEGYIRKGLNFYGGTLALDTASMVVPGMGYHAETKYRDHFLFPDLDTLTPVAWLNNTAKVICDPYWNPNEPVKAAPRYVLKKLLEKADALGFDVMMSIDIITHNCEYAPSQFEINYDCATGILAADKAFTFKNAVKEIAHRLGYHATFMSKPAADMSGSCCHFHINLITANLNRV